MRATARRAGLVAIALLGASSAASTSSAFGARAEDADRLPPLELGRIPQFPSETDAHQFCPHDVVVWADPASGYFYPHWHPKYARSPGGTFTCLREAKRAAYWNINPFADDPERGREFPIDPSLLDPGV